MEIRIKDSSLQQAAAEGMDAFVDVFVDAINATRSRCWPTVRFATR